MYRFTSSLNNIRLVLVRRQIADGTASALVVLRAPVRQYANESCPPPKPKSRKLLMTTVGATFAIGAAVVYAKHSPKACSWLEKNVPWADDIVTIIYAEQDTHWEFTSKQLAKMKQAFVSFMFGKPSKLPQEIKSPGTQNIEEEASKAFASKNYQSTVIQTKECEPTSSPEIEVTVTDVELEKEMHQNTKIAVENFLKAAMNIEKYNTALFKAVETPLEELNSKVLGSFQELRVQKDKTIASAKESASKARKAMDELESRINSCQLMATPESIAATKRYLQTFRADIKRAEEACFKEQEKSFLYDKYKEQVEAARKYFQDDLKMLFPCIDLEARSLELKEDADLLLLHMMRQVRFLQNQVAYLNTVALAKISKAVECNDEKVVIESKAEEMFRKEAIAKELEYQKKQLQLTAEFNKKLKEQLAKQAEIQETISRARLEKLEKEYNTKFQKNLSEMLEKERTEFKKELAAMTGKLLAIEQTLKSRAAAENEAKRSQSLWAAAEALLAATRRQDAMAKIDKEITALEKAGQGDKLVESVLKGIPAEAREKGIYTEKTLRERFDRLEDTAAKVALVGNEGGGLGMYFLSWLQSKLLFQKLGQIPQHELENVPVDFSQLDTFDIIQRARYYMDHGNLSYALRYVNLLEGAPRAAAMCWLDAARRHLEIKQAAETVMAHASLSALANE